MTKYNTTITDNNVTKYNRTTKEELLPKRFYKETVKKDIKPIDKDYTIPVETYEIHIDPKVEFILITHNDLDALGCEICFMSFFDNMNKSIINFDNELPKIKKYKAFEFANNIKMEKVIIDTFNTTKHPFFLFVDICPLASTLNKMNVLGIQYLIFDHHESNLRFNNDRNIFVHKYLKDGKTEACGTTLLKEYLLIYVDYIVLENYYHEEIYDNNNKERITMLKNYNFFTLDDIFYNAIGSWDTFNWTKEIPLNEDIFSSFPVLLNMAFTSLIFKLGQKETFDKLSRIITYHFNTLKNKEKFEGKDAKDYILSITDEILEDKNLFDYANEQKEKIMNVYNNITIIPASEDFIYDEIDRYKYAFICIEEGRYISIINEYLKRKMLIGEIIQKYDFLVYIATNNFNSGFSFRTITGKAPLHVLAQHFGGGGHNNSAGCPLPKDFILDVCYTLTESFESKVTPDLM